MNMKINEALQACGYDFLLPIQEKTIPMIRNGRNLFVQAETGSGKTLAYLVPVLERCDPESSHTEGLILVPTRELALQVYEETKRLASYTGHHAVLVIGGMDIRKQVNALRHRPSIVIGTPGRIKDLLDQDILNVSSVKLVILDEADQMISTGQRKETEYILSLCTCQLCAFSATRNEETDGFLPAEHEELIFDHNKVNAAIETFYLITEHKRRSLKKLLHTSPITQAIVFTNYKNDANELALSLTNDNILCSAFSSYFEEKQRIQILKDFREGNIRVLIATDAAARGLDITGISHIIHYDVPTDINTYIHRSGRTAHQGNSGISVSILRKEDLDTETGKYILAHGSQYEGTDTGNDLSLPLVKERRKEPDTVEIMIRAGRKDKIRVKDIIGALCTKLSFDQIGTVEIQDHYTLVSLRLQDTDVLQEGIAVKGKKRKVIINR